LLHNQNRIIVGKESDPFLSRSRPPKLSEVHKEFVRLRTNAPRDLTNIALALELSQAFPDLGTVSETVVGKCRKELELFYLPVRLECDIPECKRAFRVWWCNWQLQIQSDWRNVVFTDESWFGLGTQKRWIWPRHEDYGPDVCYSRKAHPKKIMIWGAIGFNFKSPLHFAGGTVTGEYYYDKIIMGGFLDEANRTFWHTDRIVQQDNAPPHVRADIIEAIENTAINIITLWPAYSPDLDRTERGWAIMKNRVDQYEPETLGELQKEVQRVWDDPTPGLINSLVAEMPRRLAQMIANNGHTIQRMMT
jgi:hypothetical protein